MKLKIVALSIGVLALSACSSTGAMKTTNPEGVISGKVTRNVFAPDRVEVALDGKTYRGEWDVKPPTAEQREGASYRHASHMGMVSSRLVADDGSSMECQWKTHLISAEGGCKSSGRDYSLNLE